MTNFNIKEIIAGVLLIIVSVLLFFVIKNQKQIIDKQNIIETSIVEQKQLANDLIRAKSSYVTEDQMKTLLKENKVDTSSLQNDLDSLRAEVKGINVTVIRTVTERQTDIPSDKTEPKTGETVTIDKYGYLNSKQTLDLDEKFTDTSVPFGKVSFSAWEGKPWEKEIYGREYKSVGVLSYDRDGKGYFHNKFSIKVNDKEYDVKVDQSSFYEEYPESHFGFNPRIYVGAGLGYNFNSHGVSTLVSGGVSFFYYGKTKLDPDWIFLQPGIGYDIAGRKVNGELGLAFYNIAHHLPLVNNIFIGPSISTSFVGDYTGLVSLKFGL